MGKNDDNYVAMDTESVEDTNSAGSRVKRFISQFFLFLVVCFLAFLLVCQIIAISSVSEVQVDKDALQAGN